MSRLAPDIGLEALLDLDGEVLVVDPKGHYWVKFEVRRVQPSPDRPHGLAYPLTLHGPDNQRLVGFDNAHKMRRSAGPAGRAKDHPITSTIYDQLGLTSIEMLPL